MKLNVIQVIVKTVSMLKKENVTKKRVERNFLKRNLVKVKLTDLEK